MQRLRYLLCKASLERREMPSRLMSIVATKIILNRFAKMCFKLVLTLRNSRLLLFHLINHFDLEMIKRNGGGAGLHKFQHKRFTI
jgi:hypothetical protein